MAGEAPLVVAVVVTFRATTLTIDCVESLRRSTGVGLHVVIVDNHSDDESVKAIRNHFRNAHDVTIKARTVNDGYTGGNNVGVALARTVSPNARYAFILNNDTIVAPDCVRMLVGEAERDPDIALVTPKIFFGSPRDRLWFGGGRFSLWRGRPLHVGYRELAPTEGPWSTARDIEYASGCALLLRLASVADPVFDRSLFTYAEDVDLSLRVRLAGGRIRYAPAAVMWHFEGTGHRRAGGQALRFYLNVRNLLRVAARHASWYHWITLAPSLAIDVIARYAAVAIRDRDPAALAAVFRGARHAVTGGRHPIEPSTADG